MNIKKILKKIWFLLWKDNSFKGWIFSILFLIILIKLIFFPLLSLATGTSFPLVIIESCSMYHKDNLLSNFDSWWDLNNEKYNQFNITKSQFEDFKFKKGLNKGDIMFITKADPKKLKIGDVIIFQANQQTPIIHRIISIKEINGKKIFSTIGDKNNGQIPEEKNISEEKLLGKATFKLIPYAGWIKLIFVDWKKPENLKGLCN